MRRHARWRCQLGLVVACCLISHLSEAKELLCLERPPATEPERAFCRGLEKSEMGDRAGATEHYKRAIELQPDFAEAHMMLGNQYLQEEDYPEAIASYDVYLRLRPDNARAWSNRGAAHLELGYPTEALEDIDRAVEIEPHDPMLRENRLYVADKLGNATSIIVDTTWLLENLQPNPAWLDLRGKAFDEEGRHEEALRDAEWLVQLRPDANAYCNRGSMRLVLDQHEAAEEDLSKALKLDPELALAYIKRCMARYRLQRYAEGLLDCDAYVHRVPGESYGIFVRGLLRDRTGDHDGAIADYQRATELTKEPKAIANAWYGVGLANERARRPDTARSAYLRALEVVPDHSLSRSALDRLGP